MHCQLNSYIITRSSSSKHRRVNGGFLLVEMFDKRSDSSLILKHIPSVRAFIDKFYADAGIKERQFTQALGKDFIVKLHMAEGLAAG